MVARLHSQRGARTIFIAFPPNSEARVVRAHGVPMTTPARSIGATGWSYATFYAVPDEGVELELACGVGPSTLTVLDQTSGVPPSAASVVAARPGSSVPTQDGDVTIVTSVVRL